MKFLDRFKTSEERAAYEEGYRLGDYRADLNLPPATTREEAVLMIAKLIGAAERLEERFQEAKRS